MNLKDFELVKDESFKVIRAFWPNTTNIMGHHIAVMGATTPYGIRRIFGINGGSGAAPFDTTEEAEAYLLLNQKKEEKSNVL